MALERGCRLPCTATQTLRAAAGGQGAVVFMLYQGAGDDVATARALDTFHVPTDGSTPGTHEVEVTFVAERGGTFVSAAGKPADRPLAVVRMEPRACAIERRLVALSLCAPVALRADANRTTAFSSPHEARH